ncbi:MAG TPA: class I SAM-dependent methyltransferase [Luteibaculaceae bacterium]|nr:class I SAM-dependent methyltransferase [Luteibaculaceae bacterium]
MEILSPTHWKDYALLDCGNFEKLERFGNYVTIRPEPQAVWDPKWSKEEWNKRAHIKFVPKSSTSGEWKKLKNMPDQWVINYPLNGDEGQSIKFRLGLTSFKHVGIFPEQCVNWDYISSCVSKMHSKQPKVLNLFAYTGGASLAAAKSGAQVYHVDSIKQVVTWSNQNMELSGIKDIRWVVEDAVKFVQREVRRGSKYQGIILDPPAYGHGPKGEKWKLEDQINDLVRNVLQLLDPQEHFLILNTYSLGFSAIILENLIPDVYKKAGFSIGELYLPAESGVKLPLGVFCRFNKC